MDSTLSPLRMASFGILLIALWLICLGILNAIWIPFGISTITKMGLTITYATILLIILWKMLPLAIGFILFQRHRQAVHLLTGTALAKNDEQDNWHNTPLLATLLVGLLGIFLAARGLRLFCDESLVIWLIMEIDNRQAGQFFTSERAVATTIGLGRFPLFIPIVYPFVLGFVFIIGARRIGNLIGRQIDKSLATPSGEKEDTP
ncbi:MAG: hypothetical protein FWG73_01680 [Planctomycetaceae bacterium]|nr:hypothetical protein [Planctomycetaceae bacterium]